MSELLNGILRPVLRFIFLRLYPLFPWRAKLLWFFSKYYFINGAEDLVKITADFIKKGYFVFWNHCTEDADNFDDICSNVRAYFVFIELAEKYRLAPYVTLSLKMSQFGSFSQREYRSTFGRDSLTTIVRRASSTGMTVMLDGERLVHARDVVAFGRKMNERYGNTGVRLQAYNPEFLSLVDDVIEYSHLKKTHLPLGFCKGAYNEPSAVSAKQIHWNMIEAVKTCYKEVCPMSLDTNDQKIAEKISIKILPRAPFGRPRPTFGLLYNVKPWLARRLKERGELVRIYLPVIMNKTSYGIPTGSQWEKFAIRRLIERPLYVFLPFKMLLDKFLGRQNY